MKTDKNVNFIQFRDLVLNRANNLLFCFDGSITTLRDKSNKEFFFKQTFSHLLSANEFRAKMNLYNRNEQIAILKTKHQDLEQITNSVINN